MVMGEVRKSERVHGCVAENVAGCVHSLHVGRDVSSAERLSDASLVDCVVNWWCILFLLVVHLGRF